MKKHPIVLYLLLLFWGSALLRTDALYVVYLALCLFAAFCIGENQKGGVEIPRRHPLLWLLPAAFALAVDLAEWDRFLMVLEPADYFAVRKVTFALTVLLVTAGSIVVAREILCFLLRRIKPQGDGKDGAENGIEHARSSGDLPRGTFLFVFFLFWAVDLLYLFLCAYPGNLTTDSLSQIEQILSGRYSDHHPYWHTRFVGLFLTMGEELFGNLSAGVAFYHVVQAGLLCLVFAYVTTVLGRRLGKKAFAATVLYYLLVPVHTLYSVTLWKDVLFGAAVTLFAVAFFVLSRSPAEGLSAWKSPEGALALTGALAACLFRSNGFWMMAGTAVVLLLVFRKKALPVAGIVLCCFLLNHAILPALSVEKADALEAVALPLQQVAYTAAVQEAPLTQEEEALLQALAPIADWAAVYDPELVDPLKGLFRSRNTVYVLEENKGAFFSLWLRLGLCHPGAYLHAFVTQTRGYWNAGYPHYLWAQGVGGNALGLAQVERSHLAKSLKNSYLWLFEEVEALQILKAIGLLFWGMVLVGGALCIRRRREAAVLSPFVFLFGTLFLATPVNNEYRYIYALACALPFVLSLLNQDPEEPKREETPSEKAITSACQAGEAVV